MVPFAHRLDRKSHEIGLYALKKRLKWLTWQQEMPTEGYINPDTRLLSFYQVWKKRNPLRQLTRQETMRWLITTAATAHQRCFSQASKKTTPQNMCRRIMAMVIKAENGETLLHAAVCSRRIQLWNGRAATWGQEVVLGVPVDPHGARPHRVSQDVHHREGSAHESETEARNWDKTEVSSFHVTREMSTRTKAGTIFVREDWAAGRSHL